MEFNRLKISVNEHIMDHCGVKCSVESSHYSWSYIVWQMAHHLLQFLYNSLGVIVIVSIQSSMHRYFAKHCIWLFPSLCFVALVTKAIFLISLCSIIKKNQNLNFLVCVTKRPKKYWTLHIYVLVASSSTWIMWFINLLRINFYVEISSKGTAMIFVS